MSLPTHPAILKFLTVFVASMPEACKTQFGIVVKPGSPHPIDWNSLRARSAAVARIDVSGDQLNGYVLLAFPKETFLKGASSVFGEGFTDITSENLDFGGEILNIVFGVAKAKLKDQHDLPISLAIPSCQLAENLDASLELNPGIEIAYESEWGPLSCAFCFTGSKSKAA